MLKCAFMVEYTLPSHCACRTGIKRWDQTNASWNGTDQKRTRRLASQEEGAEASRSCHGYRSRKRKVARLMAQENAAHKGQKASRDHCKAGDDEFRPYPRRCGSLACGTSAAHRTKRNRNQAARGLLLRPRIK